MRHIFLILVTLILLGSAYTVLAQDDTPTAVEGVELPEWANALAFGTLSLSLLVAAATEVTKAILKLFGLYKDGWGRWIVGVWALGFVVLAFASQLLDVTALVDERVAWLYQVMLLLLTLLGAPTAFKWAKATGLVE